MFESIFKEWDEEKHPRDERGRFASGAGGAEAALRGAGGYEPPPNWDKGFGGGLQIGAGGKETPFIQGGQWKLRVWDSKNRKHYLYNYQTDMLEEEEIRPYQENRIGFQAKFSWDNIFKWNPEQERAADGKWTDGGGKLGRVPISGDREAEAKWRKQRETELAMRNVGRAALRYAHAKDKVTALQAKLARMRHRRSVVAARQTTERELTPSEYEKVKAAFSYRMKKFEDVFKEGFKHCKDCSGSTGPTCKANEKCIGAPT